MPQLSRNGRSSTLYIKGNEYGKFSLKNNGVIPLYLIEVPDPSEPRYSYPNSELPPLVIPRYKLVDGKVYYYSVYKPNPYSYIQEAGGIDNSAAYELDISQWELEKMGVKITNVYKDDRLASTTPPVPQDFYITAYHGNKQITIKGVITYMLNEEYDPKAGEKTKEACDRSFRTQEFLQTVFSLAGTIILSIVAVLGAIVVYRKIKKKSIKKLFLIFLVVLMLYIAVWFFGNIVFGFYY